MVCLLLPESSEGLEKNYPSLRWALPTVYQCFPLWTLITIVATLGQTLPSLTDSAFVVMDLTCKLGYENN